MVQVRLAEIGGVGCRGSKVDVDGKGWLVSRLDESQRHATAAGEQVDHGRLAGGASRHVHEGDRGTWWCRAAWCCRDRWQHRSFWGDRRREVHGQLLLDCMCPDQR